MLAKLFSEAVEAIDPQPVEGIKRTGADKIQQVIFGVIPQVMISYSLYRFESNVRSATVLGIVGAGGIGVILGKQIRGFNYAGNGRDADRYRRQRHADRRGIPAPAQDGDLKRLPFQVSKPSSTLFDAKATDAELDAFAIGVTIYG